MNIARNFILIGAVFLFVGVLIGMYMGGSGDYKLAPAHAHINLLGFALMSIFGLVYKVFPAMAESRLAQVHFWLHVGGSLVVVTLLTLLLLQMIPEAAMVPLAPLSELAILIGVGAFFLNAVRNVN